MNIDIGPLTLLNPGYGPVTQASLRAYSHLDLFLSSQNRQTSSTGYLSGHPEGTTVNMDSRTLLTLGNSPACPALLLSHSHHKVIILFKICFISFRVLVFVHLPAVSCLFFVLIVIYHAATNVLARRSDHIQMMVNVGRRVLFP